MTFEEILDHALVMLQRRGRVTYGTLKRQFSLDDAALEDLKQALLYEYAQMVDDPSRGLIWRDETTSNETTSTAQLVPPASHPALQWAIQEAPAIRAEPSLTDPGSLDAERRQLTVMFCDLVSSMTLAARLDPEEWREVVRAYQAACAAVIQRFEGYIAQYLGDGSLVYFGYPRVHEDDAQRAAWAGLGMLQAMGALHVRLEREGGIRLAVRIGIHTGPVVVGEMRGDGKQEQFALGDTPNIASRIQGWAAPDTVVTSETTYRLVQGYFVCQTLGT
jgi:class 3 adenylate cyclase